VKHPRAPASLLTLIDNLFEYPIITAAQAAKVMDVTASAAQVHIDRLVGAKILFEITGRKWGRHYAAKAILRCLDDASGGLPIR